MQHEIYDFEIFIANNCLLKAFDVAEIYIKAYFKQKGFILFKFSLCKIEVPDLKRKLFEIDYLVLFDQFHRFQVTRKFYWYLTLAA